MFKNHIIFQILYIVVPLCSALSQTLFLQSPSFQQVQSALICNWHSALWLAEHHKLRLKCNAPFHNRDFFQSKYKDSQ